MSAIANIACLSEFAQAPTSGDCEGILAYYIRHGRYGEVSLDGLNLVRLVSFKGNFWAGEGKVKTSLASFFDDRGIPNNVKRLGLSFREKPEGSLRGSRNLWRASSAEPRLLQSNSNSTRNSSAGE